ncbi:hypothetical protein AMK22_17715 [Streptomyces sp. CB01580]|nr:hypothetical protein AMK22_17715 [Streptomyces sp. CB01580]
MVLHVPGRRAAQPPHPLRRFLDRELSAGAKALRDNYRAQHRADHILPPPPGVGTEVGIVGKATDQRLRLAFTAAAPVDDASLVGVEGTGGFGDRGRDCGCARSATSSRHA